MIELKNCPICKEEKWHSLDKLRDQNYWYDRDIREKDEPVGFKICKECGFITYDYVDEKRLSDHYDRERPVMQAGNIVTCNRKNEYHDKFLSNILVKNDILNILDVGCAQGSFLKYAKDMFQCNITKYFYGTEWSTAFRNFGIKEYGLNITKEIDESIIYDFISYYHVLEHIQNPDKELEKIYKLLNDEGYLYISVPFWLDELEEKSGTMTSDFENLYHLNHVNVFTKKSLQNLLGVYGFEIIKENDEMYGYTVLCKKIDKAPDNFAIQKEDYKIQEEKLKKQKEAIMFFNQKQFDKAIEIYPEYPDAYIGKALSKDCMKDFQLGKEVLGSGLKVMPDNLKLLKQLGQLYFQWDENTPDKQYYSNNIKESENILLNVLERKPGQEDICYFLGMINCKYKKDYEKAVEYFKKVLYINPMKFAEIYNLIALCWKEIK